MQNSVPGGQSIYNSGQYLQSAVQQSGPRHAHLSQTMAQSNNGEGPQIRFIEPRPASGLHPVVVQVAPQSQFFRQVERQLPPPSDQGMLSIGTQGGTSIQHPDRYSGSDSSSANTAIQQQATSGAQLTQQLGNYMITSPQAMTLSYSLRNSAALCHDSYSNSA